MRRSALARATLLAVGLLLVGTGRGRADEMPAAPREATGAPAVADYTLRATLDPAAHTVHGEGTIRWRNASQVAVHEVFVHLYLNAFKNDQSVLLRTPLAGGRGAGPLTDWGYIDVRSFSLRTPGGAPVDVWKTAEVSRPNDPDETDARVPLPRAVEPGEEVVFDVVWDSKLPSIVERTGYEGSFHFVGQWFPKIAKVLPDGRFAHFPFHRMSEFFADFGTYDVTLDVPEAFTVGATGPVVESRRERGRLVERHVQPNVHDFAWTAWNEWLTVKERIGEVDVTLLYPPGYRTDATREMAALRFSLPHLAARYGRYPYDLLTVVHPPHTAAEAGGMEYPTLITTGGYWYGPPGSLEPEIVTVHELGHQWFYGLLASNEHDFPFLDEGLNSFAELETMQAWRGDASAFDLFGITLSDAALQAMLANLWAHDEPVAQAAPEFASGTSYGLLVYYRTGALFETMRRVYGDDALMGALGAYARRYRFMHPEPRDLFSTLSEAMGAAPAEFLRSGLYERGWVDFVLTEAVSHQTREPGGVFDRDGRRQTVTAAAEAGSYDGWVVVTRRGTLILPVDVDLHFGDGSVRRLHWNGEGSFVRLPFSAKSPLKGAVLDPEERVLVDERRANNQASIGLSGKGTMHATEWLLYWAQIALGAILP